MNAMMLVMIMPPQKRQGKFSKLPGDSIFGPFIDGLDDQNVQDRVADGLDIKGIAERIEADWDDMGKHAANRLHQMMEMEKILLTSGWLNHSENKIAVFSSLFHSW